MLNLLKSYVLHTAKFWEINRSVSRLCDSSLCWYKKVNGERSQFKVGEKDSDSFKTVEMKFMLITITTATQASPFRLTCLGLNRNLCICLYKWLAHQSMPVSIFLRKRCVELILGVNRVIKCLEADRVSLKFGQLSLCPLSLIVFSDA